MRAPFSASEKMRDIMSREIQWSDVETAIAVLQRSERGRHALKCLSRMLDEGAVSLDFEGQAAVKILLLATWGPYTGSARDVMRDAVAGNLFPVPRA